MHTFLITYLAISLAASMAVIAVGFWIRRMREPRKLPLGPVAADFHELAANGLAADGLAADALAAGPPTDVRAALIVALKRLTPILGSRHVRADVAVPPGLLVRMPGAALTDLLEDLLAATIQQTPPGRVLLASSLHGGQVRISLSDGIPGANLEDRRGRFRQMTERVALSGGALDFDVRPQDGTIMTLRLTAASARPSGLQTAEQSTPEADAVTRAGSNHGHSLGATSR